VTDDTSPTPDAAAPAAAQPATPGAAEPATAGAAEPATAVHRSEPVVPPDPAASPDPVVPAEPVPAPAAETPVPVAPPPADAGRPEPVPAVPAQPATTASGLPNPHGLPDIAVERPEIAVGAAFGGGLVLALILKRLAR
jgi:hypothetical protein